MNYECTVAQRKHILITKYILTQLMSLTYRSSYSFNRPLHYTISHVEVEDVLYNHKKRLSMNKRSTSRDESYKTQRLCVEQVRTIENLAKTTKIYSLNALLNNYHRNWDDDNIQKVDRFHHKRPNSEHVKGRDMNFETIEPGLPVVNNVGGICPQKMRLFKQGVNYRSRERARGSGVRKMDVRDLQAYFNRMPQEEHTQLLQNGCQMKDRSATHPSRTRVTHSSSLKFTRIKSHRLCG